MSEKKKKFIETNARMMAEMDEESLKEVNAFLTGVTLGIRKSKAEAEQRETAEEEEAKADSEGGVRGHELADRSESRG